MYEKNPEEADKGEWRGEEKEEGNERTRPGMRVVRSEEGEIKGGKEKKLKKESVKEIVKKSWIP